MYLSELTSYKKELLQLLCNSKEIVKLLTVDEPIEYPEDLIYRQIYPYAYMPDIKQGQSVFICCEVEVPRAASPNDSFKYTALHIYLLVHNKLMQMEGGTRLDLLADCVDRILSGNREFGLGGGLQLVSLSKFMPMEEYYGAELYYEGVDFHCLNSAK